MGLTDIERHALGKLSAGGIVDERDIFPEDVTQGRPILESMVNRWLIDYVDSRTDTTGLFSRYRIADKGRQALTQESASE